MLLIIETAHTMEKKQTDQRSIISIIVPVHNGEQFIEDCFNSILKQTYPLNEVEVSVWNDASSDRSVEIINSYKSAFEAAGAKLILGHGAGQPRGCGFAKNRAVEQSTGQYLCFLDVDDYMMPDRLKAQFLVARDNPDAIVGSRFHREPSDSTKRYARWANTLSNELLEIQVYTSHGPTVIMPTWFCSRRVFKTVGGFSEEGRGTPEDLIFFFRHLDHNGKLMRVNQDLLMYRYHQLATTFSISESTIWDIRVARIQQKVLPAWASFTIWNAGKQGRRFFRSLSEENKKKVAAFCDVSAEKINRGVYVYQMSPSTLKPRIPIIHFKDAKPPLVVCVKIDLMERGFAENLASLNLAEGTDYIHFA